MVNLQQSTAHQPPSAPSATDYRSKLITTALPLAIVVTVIATLASRATGQITDPDPWWHLRLGVEFRENWRVYDPGTLSPFADAPWVPTQWVLEIAASWLVDRFGLGAVAWLTGVGVVALGAALWHANRVRSGTLAASVATAMALMGMVPVIAPRPQVASLIFLSIYAAAWWRTSVDGRPRWWLVPFTWLWACTHGFWFVGVLIGFAIVVGMALDRRLTGRHSVSLLTVCFGSLVAAALTPAGPKLMLAPFKVSGISGRITEWQPPDFHSPFVLVVGAMAAAFLLTKARTGKATWTELAVCVIACLLLVYAARSVALAAVLLAPLVAEAIQTWTRRSVTRPDRRETLTVTMGLVAALVVASLMVIVRAPYDHPYPAEVDRVLAALPEGTIVFNEYVYGGWLAWAHPHLIHGIDGLTEAYTPSYINSYLDAQSLRPGWQQFLDGEVAADAAFLPANSPMAVELSDHMNWKPLAETNQYVVLLRR